MPATTTWFASFSAVLWRTTRIKVIHKMFLIPILLMAQIVGNSEVNNAKKVKDIPIDEEEHKEMIGHMNCPSGKVPMFLLNDTAETILGCYEDKDLTGYYCPELNVEKVQERYNAACQHFTVTPCVYRYKASEGWKYYECFEKYGGIETLLEKIAKVKQENTIVKQENAIVKQKNAALEKKRDGWYIVALTVIVIAVLLIVALILMFLRGRRY